MNAHVAAGQQGVISKSEFARRRNVSPARVTQWIAEGKIDGLAIVGEGRNAQILEAVAIAQLNERLDVSQRFGNGLTTNLEPPTVAGAVPPNTATVLPFGNGSPKPPAPETAVDTVEKLIAREKLEQIQRANRRANEEDAIRAGRLVSAEVANQQQGRIASQLLNLFEGALSEFASAISAKHQIPQRDLVHLLNIEFRKVRSSAAAMFRKAAADMPALQEFELDDKPVPDAVDRIIED